MMIMMLERINKMSIDKKVQKILSEPNYKMINELSNFLLTRVNQKMSAKNFHKMILELERIIRINDKIANSKQ